MSANLGIRVIQSSHKSVYATLGAKKNTSSNIQKSLKKTLSTKMKINKCGLNLINLSHVMHWTIDTDTDASVHVSGSR